MIKPTTIAAAILVVTSIPALAQAGNPPPAPQGTQPLTVLGQTGTMYDGSNAKLQLSSEPNAYWARLWAQPGAQGSAGAASAVGAGAMGSSLGGAETGGQH